MMGFATWIVWWFAATRIGTDRLYRLNHGVRNLDEDKAFRWLESILELGYRQRF